MSIVGSLCNGNLSQHSLSNEQDDGNWFREWRGTIKHIKFNIICNTAIRAHVHVHLINHIIIITWNFDDEENTVAAIITDDMYFHIFSLFSFNRQRETKYSMIVHTDRITALIATKTRYKRSELWKFMKSRPYENQMPS